MQAFILRSKNRIGYDSVYASYEPESISAWGEQPDLSMAPVEAWELVEDLEQAYRESPACAPKQISSSEPQETTDPVIPAHPPEEEGV